MGFAILFGAAAWVGFLVYGWLILIVHEKRRRQEEAQDE